MNRKRKYGAVFGKQPFPGAIEDMHVDFALATSDPQIALKWILSKARECGVPEGFEIKNFSGPFSEVITD